MKKKLILGKIMHGNRFITIVLLILAVILTLYIGKDKKTVPNKNEKEIQVTESENEEEKSVSLSFKKSDEMRAVWIPFMTLAMDGEKSEKAFKEKFETIAQNSLDKGMNTLIVQVRPFSDALYESDLYPWSHILTGRQGKDPGYDPLKIMIKTAHEKGMELHAWINPLRISTKGIPEKLSDDNPYEMWKGDEEKEGYTSETDDGIYMNPAYEEVRAYIIDGVKEITDNYDVDGIQSDDYFYPTSDEYFDENEYEAYCENEETPLSLHDWRQANISSLIAGVYHAVKSSDESITFGISPQGNLQNVYNACADVYAWGAVSGYVDYLCPQMYVSLENEALPFEDTLRTWRELVSNEDIKLYVGLAVYKAGSDVDNGQWKKSNDILQTELTLGRKIPCDGFMFYSYDYLIDGTAKEEVANVMKVLND